MVLYLIFLLFKTFDFRKNAEENYENKSEVFIV